MTSYGITEDKSQENIARIESNHSKIRLCNKIDYERVNKSDYI